MKVYKNGPGHMTKVATVAINKKKQLYKSSSQEPEGYDFETCYEASGRGALQSLEKKS